MARSSEFTTLAVLHIHALMPDREGHRADFA